VTLRISIIIPVYNEESAIGDLLPNLHLEPADEALVVDGGSTDRTVQIASSYARVIHSELGRAQQLNMGARHARGDILLFLHADARIDRGALEELRRVMSDPHLHGGNFDIRYAGQDIVATVFTHINRWRRRCGIFYGDSGIFCRRSTFEALGGYPPWPIMEDYAFARRLWKLGNLALLAHPIQVSDRRWRQAGLARTLWSWFCIQSLYSLGVPPNQLARLYKHVR
jgi:rSAM/selenodomain-associated transferase 2